MVKALIPSEKIRKKAGETVRDMTLVATGVRPGETIIGKRNVTKGALLKVVSGIVPPSKSRLDEVRLYPDLWNQLLNKLAMFPFFANMSHEQRVAYLETNQEPKEVHISDSEEVKLQVIQLGDSDFTKKLSPEDINALSADPDRIWPAPDIMSMFPRKAGSRAKRQSLFFHRPFWQINVAFASTHDFNGLVIDVNTGKLSTNDSGEIIVIKELDIGFKVIKNNPSYDSNIIYNLVLAHYPDHTLNHIQLIDNATREFTPAAYKSLLQKIIRFRPKYVKIGDLQLNAGFTLLTTLSLLLLNPGSFVPDIQRYVTGMESFCKRLAVTIFEDSYLPPEWQSQLVSMLASALLVQRIKGWKPTVDMINVWFALAKYSWENTLRFNYDTGIGMGIFKYNINVNSNSLEVSSFLLTDIKSFAGDLAMIRHIATLGGQSINPSNNIQPEVMPLEHSVDQHWAPEIVYFFQPELIAAVKEEGNTPFKRLFDMLFQQVTGINTRKQPLVNDNFLEHVRLAQHRLLVAKQESMIELPILQQESITMEVTIGNSWLAGMAGALTISGRPEAIVTLSPNDLHKLVAIQKPSRNMKSAQLTDEREEEVIDAANKMLIGGIPLNKCKPPIGFYDGAKLFKSEDEYFVQSGGVMYPSSTDKFNITIPFVESVPITITNSLTRFGNGITNDAINKINSLISTSDVNILRRVLGHLSGYKSTIEMNKISRNGGGSELAVTYTDTAAFQFLLKLSMIYPLAIRKVAKRSTRFEIPLSPLLWQLRDYIASIVIGNTSYDNSRWGIINDVSGRTPWAHQIESLNEMKIRNASGKKGHFIWIPVGLGKTWIVLSYLKYLYDNNRLPNYIIYSLPDSAIKSIIQEIKLFGFQVELLYPIQKKITDSDLLPYVNNSCDPKPFHISLIEHDHMRRCPEGLTKIAGDSLIIIDEVHLALNDTQRTSIALELSHLALDFVALTGTPVIDTKLHKLIHWLEQIVEFEVTTDNFWVAANSMIAKKVNTGVIVNRIEIEAPFTPEEQLRYQALVSPAHGGTNLSTKVQDYQEAARISYTAITRQLIIETVNELNVGNRVFLVAKDMKHQQELNTALLRAGLRSNDIFLIERGKSIFLSDDSVASGATPDYRVVITPINKSTGYTVTRMNVMISGVYPSNNAVREQVEGRINRISQKNKNINFKIVHAGILTYTMLHHKDAKNLSDVLKTLADDIN